MSILRLEHIEKTYLVENKPITVLRDICLDFSACGLVFLLGPSGSGKTTLLHIIAGIAQPSSGVIYEDEIQRKSRIDKGLFTKKYSILFQQCHLLETHTPFYNVVLPYRIHGLSRRQAEKKARLLFDSYQLTHLMKRQTKSLSGGERQRIALLRTLAMESDILLADEPTGALDEENGHYLMNQLAIIAQTKLVIVVSHNQELVDQYAHRVIHLFDGRVVLDETRERLDTIESRPRKPPRAIKDSLLLSLAVHDIKHHFRRHTLSLFASLFSLTCVMLGAIFYETTKTFIDDFTPLVVDCMFVQVSKKTSYQVEDSPLILTKSERPTSEEMQGLMSYFPLSTYSVDFKPILNQSVKLSIDGTSYSAPSISFYNDAKSHHHPAVIYLNSLAYPLFPQDSLTKPMDLLWDIVVSQPSGDFHYEISKTFTVKLDENETEFMNEPRLYVPYFLMLDAIASLLNESSSQSLIEVLKALPNDHPLSSYSYVLLLDDVSQYRQITALNQAKSSGMSFQFHNQQMLIQTSYQGMFSGLHMVIVIFLLIALIGTLALLGISTYTNIQLRRKEMAILTVLGMRKSHLWSMILYENSGLSLISIFGANLIIFLARPIFVTALTYVMGLPTTLISLRYGALMASISGVAFMFIMLITAMVWLGIDQISLEKELNER